MKISIHKGVDDEMVQVTITDDVTGVPVDFQLDPDQCKAVGDILQTNDLQDTMRLVRVSAIISPLVCMGDEDPDDIEEPQT